MISILQIKFNLMLFYHYYYDLFPNVNYEIVIQNCVGVFALLVVQART